MSDRYRVSWAMQQQASSSINSAVGTMNATLAQLNAQVAALEATWEGDAEGAYTARQQVWNGAARRIEEALIAFKAGMDRAAAAAAAGEAAAKATVAG